MIREKGIINIKNNILIKGSKKTLQNRLFSLILL